ncbi:inositol monophosphatase family protein [Sneathiella sp. HT1-7]|jgi:myo-inositol-1(or 4)-monophosphatase|uniref:inositol monophosphatase family protein n=1 Tax=Sneathiella sp. HT1-7 TaxID=2887192 RepID=UPI001D13AD8E|nr:inositol monophosphatase family protein [Sneathiella sp. HT1-7]MCC3305412.1 inositol monophosphatase [Sneathiella sp. HT1-7]
MARKSAIINAMELSARKAARKLLRDFNEVEHLQVSRKGPADFVSQADLTCEATLREELGRLRPDFGFILEEGGVVEAKDGTTYWVVDPLDGTTNFLHGLPHFSISIGVKSGKEIIAGIILDPVKDELFWAEKGGGAYMNDRRLRVSSRTKMTDCILATGIPFTGKTDHGKFLQELEQVMSVSAGVRRFGSAALDLAYVAAGRYDGFWERNLAEWDIAAGIIIAREAGALVSQLDGGEKMLEKGDILATNSGINSQMMEIFRKIRLGR